MIRKRAHRVSRANAWDYVLGLTAVNDVSFAVREREILSVIGPNGAGKSTLFKLIASFVKPTTGRVAFQGETISGRAPHCKWHCSSDATGNMCAAARI